MSQVSQLRTAIWLKWEREHGKEIGYRMAIQHLDPASRPYLRHPPSAYETGIANDLKVRAKIYEAISAGNVKAGDMAAYCGMTRQKMAHLLRMMSERGLVSKKPLKNHAVNLEYGLPVMAIAADRGEA